MGERNKIKDAEIIAVIDRSGSMGAIIDDAIGGLNTFIEGQKSLNSKTNLTLVMFDSEYNVVYENEPIENVKDFDRNNYVPRGSTALLDAIGKSIALGRTRKKDVGSKKVIFVVLTDGMENASIEYTLTQIKSMIKDQKREGWEFLFLSADENSINDAINHYGFDKNNTVKFDYSGKGVRVGYDSLSAMTLNLRK